MDMSTTREATIVKPRWSYPFTELRTMPKRHAKVFIYLKLILVFSAKQQDWRRPNWRYSGPSCLAHNLWRHWRWMICRTVAYPSQIPRVFEIIPLWKNGFWWQVGHCEKVGANKRWMCWKVNESWRSNWMGTYRVAHDFFYRKVVHQEVRREVAVTSSSLFC
jgi:hypothetical protein